MIAVVLTRLSSIIILVAGSCAPFIIGRMSEVVKPGTSVARMALDVAKIIAAAVTGTIIWFVITVAA